MCLDSMQLVITICAKDQSCARVHQVLPITEPESRSLVRPLLPYEAQKPLWAVIFTSLTWLLHA